MRPGFLHTCLVSLYFLITSAASPRDKYRDRDAEHLPEVRTPDLSKEPTCDELRAMWRFSKRQSRAAESTNEIPTYRDPFAYNVWEDQATLRSVGGGKLRRPYIYGRLVHSTQRPRFQTDTTPERIRALEELARIYGTPAHVPKVHGRRRPSTYRLVGGQGLSHGPQQTGSFQHLKELIQSERARELHEQKMSEDRESALQYQRMMSQNQHPQLDAVAGRSRPQLEGVVAFPDLTGLAPSKYDRDTDLYTNLNYMQRSYPDSLTVAGWQRDPSGIRGYQRPALAAAPGVVGSSQVLHQPERWSAAAGPLLQARPAYKEQPHHQSPVWKRSMAMVGEKTFIQAEGIPVFKRQFLEFERPLHFIQPANEEMIGDAPGIDGALLNKGKDEGTDTQQKTNQQMNFFKNYFDIIKKEDENDTPFKRDDGNNLIEKYTPGDIERYFDGDYVNNDMNIPLVKRAIANTDILNFNKPKLVSEDDQNEISRSGQFKKVIKNNADQNSLEESIYNENEPSAESDNMDSKIQFNVSNYTVWHNAEVARYARDSEHVPQQELTEMNNNLEQIMTSSEGKKMLYQAKGRQVNEKLQTKKNPKITVVLKNMPKMEIKDERHRKITQDRITNNEYPYFEVRYVSETSTHIGGGMELKKLTDDEDQLNWNERVLDLRTSYEQNNEDRSAGKDVEPEDLETSDHQKPTQTANDMIYFNPYHRKITYKPKED